MPVTLEFENDGAGVIMTATGAMNASLIEQANARLYQPEPMRRLRYQIVDLRDVEQVDTDWDKIKALAEMDKAAADVIPGLKIAIVVRRGILDGLAQVYCRYAKDDSLQTKVFDSITAARCWISDCVDMEQSA